MKNNSFQVWMRVIPPHLGCFLRASTLRTRLLEDKLSFQAGYHLNHETNQGQRLARGINSITDAALLATAEYKPIKSLNLKPGLRYAYNSSFDAPLIVSLAARQVTPQLGSTCLLWARLSGAQPAPKSSTSFLWMKTTHIGQ
ncbi:MAG: hypothetical protein U5L96_04955 [Owenweeksia sp.]|nr:hypothetical protein [Owenweeksia sp.]